MRVLGGGRWTGVARVGGHVLGVANLAVLAVGADTELTLGVAVVLAPLTIASVFTLTASLACSLLGYALGDRRERTELLVCAIAGLQPPRAGERYREALLAEINAFPPAQLQALRADLIHNVPTTVLAAWARPLRATRCRPAATR